MSILFLLFFFSGLSPTVDFFFFFLNPRFVTEYIVEGDVFIYNDIVLFLHRILVYPQQQRQEYDSPRRQLPPFEQMTPLEKSGSYILQASMRVQDGNNQEAMKVASQQLLALRGQLRSAVRLEPADRLSLDSRAK